MQSDTGESLLFDYLTVVADCHKAQVHVKGTEILFQVGVFVSLSGLAVHYKIYHFRQFLAQLALAASEDATIANLICRAASFGSRDAKMLLITATPLAPALIT